MDTAQLSISSQVNKPLQLLYQVDECHKCAFIPLTLIKPYPATSDINVSTVYATEFAVRSQGSSENICRLKSHLVEYGRYSLTISQSGNATNCTFFKENSVYHDANAAIYVAVGVLLGSVLIWQLGKWGLERHRVRFRLEHQFAVASESDQSSTASASTDSALSKPAIARRLQSLDTFRGLTLILMIFVNNGGGGYWFFNHTPWNGLTITDLLFPWFMLIMGVSIAISMRFSAKKATLTSSKVMIGICRRSCLLFLLGLLINSMGYSSMAELRIPSVLARFGAAYLIVATCQFLLVMRVPQTVTPPRWPALADILPYWPIWTIALLFPVLHLLVTFLLPVPGCPTGYLGPGGLHDNGLHANCTGGAAGYIDRVWLGNGHIYQSPTCKPIYQSLAFDPEGLLGYLTSIFLVFLGLQAGRILTRFPDHRSRLIRLISWGVFLGLIAGALCGFSKNDGWIAVNKNLWSLSYVLASASTGFLILAALYAVIDMQAWWSGTPFFYPSVNSIVVYVGSEILDSLFPFSWHMPDTHSAQIFMALWTTSLWLLISYLLYSNNIVIAL